jgi:hemolysin activation/secretion protein
MPPIDSPLRRPLLLPAVISALLCSGALAQTAPDAGRVLQETRPTQPPPIPQTPPRVVDAPVRPTVTMPEGMTVQVSEFRISGAVSFPAAQLTELVRPWAGRRLDIAGLNEAAGAITRHYQSAGHLLSYAYLPAQRVADGVIEIAVLEGRLEATQIVTAQDVRLRDEVIQAHTDSLPKQPVLQADVERKLLLLNDIPGVTARAAFTPGTATGAAEMVVSVAEDEPLVLRAEANNHGSRSTGEYRAGIGVQLRDVFGWGDSTGARLLVSKRGGLVSGSLNTSVPVGGDGYRIGAALSHLKYELGGAFARTGAVGSADVLGVDASYPFIRRADANLNLRAALEHKRLRDEFQLLGTANNKRNTSLEASLSGDWRDSLFGAGATLASASGSFGVLRLLDTSAARGGDPAADGDPLGTAGDWHKLVVQLLRQQALAGPWSLYGRLAAQGTKRNLDSSEKFSLSGPGAVRAYGAGEASVDQGALLSLELRFAHDYLGGNFVWSLFHDAADGRFSRRLGGAGNEVRLRGGGIGLQWNAGDLGLAASLAWRGSRAPTEGGDPHPRVYFQLTLNP